MMIVGAILIRYVIPILEKPCHLTSALASADGSKIYLQTEPPRYGQVEHRYELDFETGKWNKLSSNELLVVGSIDPWVDVVRIDQSKTDEFGVPTFRRWFHLPDDAMATDSPAIRLQMWAGRYRWSQTWQQHNQFESKEYEDRQQTKLLDKPSQYARNIVRSTDGSRLLVCKSTESSVNQYELWNDAQDNPVIARWRGRSAVMDQESKLLASLSSTVSGMSRLSIRSLADGSVISEHSLPAVRKKGELVAFIPKANRVLYGDDRILDLYDYESGFRVPVPDGSRNLGNIVDIRESLVLTDRCILDVANAKVIWKDNASIPAFRMLMNNSGHMAEAVKPVSKTGVGRRLVASQYLNGCVLEQDPMQEGLTVRTFDSPSSISTNDMLPCVLLGVWMVVSIATVRIACNSALFLLWMLMVISGLIALCVFRLENAGLITQMDRPVKWALAGLLMGTGSAVSIWFWSGRLAFWFRAPMATLYAAIAILIAKTRVFTRLSSTLDGLLTAIVLVGVAFLCACICILCHWSYCRWTKKPMTIQVHFSLLNFLIVVSMAGIVMAVMSQFKKILGGSVIFEPPAVHAIYYACGAIPIAVLWRLLPKRFWIDGLIAMGLLVLGFAIARRMYGVPTMSNLDSYLGFGSFHAAWVLCEFGLSGRVSNNCPNCSEQRLGQSCDSGSEQRLGQSCDSETANPS
jgi:hypothetical protein